MIRIVAHPDVTVDIEGYVTEAECARRVEAALAAADPSGRLASQLEYSERMRRSYIEAGDELKAVKAERDGLRQRVRQLEHNLDVEQGRDFERTIQDEVRRRLDRVMRERPRPGRG